MSITPPVGILDITNAIVRVSKLEFRGATGFDTILNNVARNTILLVDQNVEYTTDKPWGLKLPNAWVAEFDAYWASLASGNIDFNIYNNTTSGTNGYVISMDDTTITVKYDGGSALKTVTLGSTLKNDTWRKIHILFERDMISLALDGTPVLYFKDTLLRPRVYDEESGYVIASGLSADRKVKNLKVVNGDKWITDGTSNIAYTHGNVGIGTTQAAHTLDVHGDIRATGNLLIEGLTTTVDTQNLSIEDAIVEIGRGNDGGTSGKDVGFLFTRNNGANTTNSNVALIYDESTDRLTLGYSDGSPTASTLAINTSKSLDVVIPSGNLGVGTDSPDYPLHVVGNVGIDGDIFTKNWGYRSADGSTTNLYIGRFSRNRPVNIEINTSGTSVGSTSTFEVLRHYNAHPVVSGNVGEAFARYQWYYQSVDTSDYDLWVRPIHANSGNYDIRALSSGYQVVTEPGSPTLVSCVYGVITCGKYNENSLTGIGTASPTHLLDLYKNSTNGASIKLESSGGYASTIGQKSSASSDRALQFTNAPYAGSNPAFTFLTLNSAGNGYNNLFTITGEGNVGIGTSGPPVKLSVYGEGEKLRLYDSGGRSVVSGTDGNMPWFGTGSNHHLRIVANNSEKMRVTTDGNVGIGTATPYAKLHVYGSGGGSITSASRSYFRYGYTGVTADTAAWGAPGIYAHSSIVTNDYIVSHAGTIGASDTRIKKNIVDADDAECLETLRLLKPKKYQYKDEINRGQEPVWGFIAQEVRDTLPYATELRRDVLPNIYELANVSQSNVITFVNFNTSNLESNATTLIRTKGIDGEDHDIHLVEVIDEHTIRVEEDLSAWTGSVDAEGNVITEITTTTLTPGEYEALEDKTGCVANISGYQNANVVISVEEYNGLEDTTGYEEVIENYTKTTTIYPGTQLFVYGQEVDDFIFVKKEAIWTVATAALQEVDRQLQAEKVKVATLETQLSSVLARLDALEAA